MTNLTNSVLYIIIILYYSFILLYIIRISSWRIINIVSAFGAFIMSEFCKIFADYFEFKLFMAGFFPKLLEIASFLDICRNNILRHEKILWTLLKKKQTQKLQENDILKSQKNKNSIVKYVFYFRQILNSRKYLGAGIISAAINHNFYERIQTFESVDGFKDKD